MSRARRIAEFPAGSWPKWVVVGFWVVVRSVLVAALDQDLGRWMWWPSKLARKPDPAQAGLSRRRSVGMTAGTLGPLVGARAADQDG
jgi:hypothetical protein